MTTCAVPPPGAPVVHLTLVGTGEPLLPSANGVCLETYRVAERGLSTLLDGTNER